MDSIRFTRELAGNILAIGCVLLVPSIVILVLIYTNLITLTAFYNIIPILVVMILVCFLCIPTGGMFWFLYYVGEWLLLRKITQYISTEDMQTDLEGIVLSPAYILDTIDREILEIVKSDAGDILAVENQMKRRALSYERKAVSIRLANLINVRMIGLHKEKVSRRLFLTPMGHEAISIPPAVYSSRIPSRVRQHMYEAKRQLWINNWGQVVLETHKAVEAAYKNLLLEKRQIDDSISEKLLEIERKEKPIERMSAGRLHNIMIETKLLKPSSFERWLSTEITKLRPPSHDKPDSRIYTTEDALRCEQYIGILMRIIFN